MNFYLILIHASIVGVANVLEQLHEETLSCYYNEKENLKGVVSFQMVAAGFGT